MTTNYNPQGEYCGNCGKRRASNEVVCARCGAPVDPFAPTIPAHSPPYIREPAPAPVNPKVPIKGGARAFSTKAIAVLLIILIIVVAVVGIVVAVAVKGSQTANTGVAAPTATTAPVKKISGTQQVPVPTATPAPTQPPSSAYHDETLPKDPTATYPTADGVTECTGDIIVDGHIVKQGANPNVGTIVVYYGSGGQIQAPNGAYCKLWDTDPRQSVIDMWVQYDSSMMKQTGCSGGCVTVVRYNCSKSNGCQSVGNV